MADELTDAKREALEAVYYDQRTGFGNRQETLRSVRAANPELYVTSADVAKFFRELRAGQPRQGSRRLNSFIPSFPLQQIQVDLAVFVLERKTQRRARPSKARGSTEPDDAEADAEAVVDDDREAEERRQAQRERKKLALRETRAAARAAARAARGVTVLEGKPRDEQGKDAEWQEADKVDDDKTPVKPKYALVAIDIFSKKAAVEPMDDSKASTAAEKMKTIFAKLGVPVAVTHDKGAEFAGEFKELLEEIYDVDQLVVRSGGIFVERFIRTLKEGIRKRLRAMNVVPMREWDSVVDFVVDKYNRTRHRTTEYTPEEAHELTGVNEEMAVKITDVRQNIETMAINTKRRVQRGNTLTLARRDDRLRVGDLVRYYVKPEHYAERKEGMPNLSKNPVAVEAVESTKSGALVYKLVGLNDRFLRSNLVRAVARKAPPAERMRRQARNSRGARAA
jgi:hypothetical protein